MMRSARVWPHLLVSRSFDWWIPAHTHLNRELHDWCLLCSVVVLSASPGRRDSSLVFCKFTSFVHPGTILKLDTEEGAGVAVQVRPCTSSVFSVCVCLHAMPMLRWRWLELLRRDCRHA